VEWNAEAWTNKEALLEAVLRRYTVYQIVRSPFLVKKVPENFLATTLRADLYLKRSD